MSVAKVTEIIASSSVSFDDAIKVGVDRARKTLKGVSGAWVKDQKVVVGESGPVGDDSAPSDSASEEKGGGGRAVVGAARAVGPHGSPKLSHADHHRVPPQGAKFCAQSRHAS